MSVPALSTDGRFVFATLTPENVNAANNFNQVCDALRRQSNDHAHHAKFVCMQRPTHELASSPASTGRSFSSNATTEDDSVARAVEYTASEGCYELTLDPTHLPLLPKQGWIMGIGKSLAESLAVDLLMAVWERHLYPRHLQFRLDGYGRLCLKVRHLGVELDGQPLNAGSSRLLLERTHFIRIFGLHYRFRLTVQPESDAKFQRLKMDFIKTYVTPNELPNELTCRTPSSNDASIGDWVVHGIAGVTSRTVIEAASNRRTGEVVAVKRRKRFGAEDAELAQREIAKYSGLKECVQKDPYCRFVMRLHSVLYLHSEQWSQGMRDEIFILWTPLGKTTFHDFAATGAMANIDQSVKWQLFVQILLALSTIHQHGTRSLWYTWAPRLLYWCNRRVC